MTSDRCVRTIDSVSTGSKPARRAAAPNVSEIQAARRPKAVRASGRAGCRARRESPSTMRDRRAQRLGGDRRAVDLDLVGPGIDGQVVRQLDFRHDEAVARGEAPAHLLDAAGEVVAREGEMGGHLLAEDQLDLDDAQGFLDGLALGLDGLFLDLLLLSLAIRCSAAARFFGTV